MSSRVTDDGYAADNGGMVDVMDRDTDKPPPGDVEFFGVKLKVNNPHLAALLNSSITEDVQVIGRRARGALTADGRAEDEHAQPDARDPENHVDGSVDVDLDAD